MTYKADNMKCNGCGKEFEGRIDARYCSSTCRVRAHRGFKPEITTNNTPVEAPSEIKRHISVPKINIPNIRLSIELLEIPGLYSRKLAKTTDSIHITITLNNGRKHGCNGEAPHPQRGDRYKPYPTSPPQNFSNTTSRRNLRNHD